MKISLKVSLFLVTWLSIVAVRAQTAAPADQPKAQAYALEKDSRESVRQFKDALAEYYSDSQLPGTPAATLKQDLSELRISSNARTATGILNPGLAILVIKSAAATVANSTLSGVVSGISQTRPDNQTTAPATATGSTALLSKTGGSSILALAVDSGALTHSASGTTSTVGGNLEGIGSLLLGQSPISMDPDHPNWLRKAAGDVNLAATFALAQPSSQSTAATQPATGTSPPAGTQVDIPSSVGKLTGISAQFTIHNPFDPHSAAMRSRWEAAKANLPPVIQAQLQAASPLVVALDCKACQQDWVDAQKKFADAAAHHSQQELADAFDAYASQAIADGKASDPKFDTYVVDAAQTTAAYQSAVKQAVDSTLGSLFTLEYDYARPANQPDTHDFKLVYGYAMSSTTAINSLLTDSSSAKSLFTANADISLYGGTIPASAQYGRLHSGQISAEFDTPILGTPPAKQAVFSLAGYWQYQPDPSVLNITQSDVAPGTSIPAPTQVLVGTAGSLWVAQAKITIKNGKSGISVPLGVKWSNKTDLLSGSKVGAQVGISYDFSSLSNLFGASN